MYVLAYISEHTGARDFKFAGSAAQRSWLVMATLLKKNNLVRNIVHNGPECVCPQKVSPRNGRDQLSAKIKSLESFPLYTVVIDIISAIEGLWIHNLSWHLN